MKTGTSILVLLAMLTLGCNSGQKDSEGTYADLRISGAMKKVMWKGELGSAIDLDSIPRREHLQGLGPETYLKGELMVLDGESYVSRVTSDSTMSVEKTFDVSAPFFVYAHVIEWEKMALPSEIISIADLEKYIDEKTTGSKRPFAFKLTGLAEKASIHVQNLPSGTKVSSPAEAHQGQTSYALEKEEVKILGFFSTEHQGVFTHHDSYLHMHLLTADERWMGHLDLLEIGNMELHLPKK